MPVADCEQDDFLTFKWVGKAREAANGVMCYSSCSINGQLFGINDDVAIKGQGKSYICTINALYEDPSNEEPNRAEVYWYFEYNELPRKCKKFFKKALAFGKELFKGVAEDDGSFFPGVIEEIDAETIESMCIVKLFDAKQKPPLNLADNEYFVRYGLRKSGDLCDIADDDSKFHRTSLPGCRKISKLPLQQDKAMKSKRKASKSMPDERIVASKRNKNTPNRKESMSLRRRAFNSEEALGRILRDSDDDDDVESSDEESSLGTMEMHAESHEKSTQEIHTLDKKKGQKQQTDENEEVSLMSSPAKSAVRRVTNSEPPKWSRKSVRSSGRITQVRKSYVDLPTASPSNKNMTQTRRRTKADDKYKLAVKNIGISMKGHDHDFNDDGDDVDDDGNDEDDNDDDFNDDDDDSDDNEYNPEQQESAGNYNSVWTGSDEFDDEDDGEDNLLKSGSRMKKRTPQFTKVRKRMSTLKLSVARTSSIKTPVGTPRRKFSKKVLTPSISDRLMPCETPNTPLEKARQRLHASSVPDSLPCREEEFAEIYAFIDGKLNSDIGGCMYISGVPGTGKTATVHEVINELESERDQGEVPTFRFIEINGMKLTEPNQAYSCLLKALTGQKTSAEHAANVLERIFSDSGRDRDHVILVIDELDLLWTRKQNVMYNLFEWPTRKHAKLIVVAVANTMDLPERIMMNRISSRLGLTRMTFQPYSFRQLQEIVYTRIKGIEVFEEDAMQLIARKVAAVSGDARRCLDICRRAVEIAESRPETVSRTKKAKEIVGMRHVNEALDEMFSSPKIVALRNLSKFQGFFMRSVVSEFRRSGLEEAPFKDIYDQFQDLCRFEGFTAPNASEGIRICSILGACKLLLIEPGNTDIYQRIRLNVSQDDVLFAMKEAV